MDHYPTKMFNAAHSRLYSVTVTSAINTIITDITVPCQLTTTHPSYDLCIRKLTWLKIKLGPRKKLANDFCAKIKMLIVLDFVHKALSLQCGIK